MSERKRAREREREQGRERERERDGEGVKNRSYSAGRKRPGQENGLMHPNVRMKSQNMRKRSDPSGRD